MRLCDSDFAGNFCTPLFNLYDKKYEILHLHREDMKFSWYSAVQMLNLGVPMGLQFSITAIGTIIVQGAINVFGEAHIAGFSAANKVQNVCTTMLQPLEQRLPPIRDKI